MHRAPTTEWAPGAGSGSNPSTGSARNDQGSATNPPIHSLVVSGAGSPRANGIFEPITQDMLPDGHTNYTSRLLFRHRENTTIVVCHSASCCHSEGMWWIGDFRDCTEGKMCVASAANASPVLTDSPRHHTRTDLYMAEGGDTSVLPLTGNVQWQPCLQEDDEGRRFGDWFLGKW